LSKSLLLAVLPAILLATPAHAENWYELAITGDAIGYGDADSVEAEGDTVSAKVMLGLREPMGSKANIEFLVSDMRFSCSEARYFVDAVTGLDAQRDAVTQMAGSREWKPVSEGSLQESFRAFACGTASARQVGDPYTATVEFWHGDEQLLDSATIELARNFDVG